MSPKSFWIRYFLPACGYMSVLVYLSLKPQNEFPAIEIPHFDKFVHFVLYTGLGGVLVRLFYHTRLIIGQFRQQMAAILVAIAYAAIDEQIQRLSPGRQPSVADFAFDTLGAISGAFLLPVYLKIRANLLSKIP